MAKAYINGIEINKFVVVDENGNETNTGTTSGSDFAVIGYEETPQFIKDDIEYSKQIYDNWDASITSLRGKFSGYTDLVYFPLVDVSNVTSFYYTFIDCVNLKVIPKLNITNKVTTFYYAFSNCKSLENIDVSNWDTSNVGNMDGLFYNCDSLQSLDLSNWNTSNVTSTSNIFTEVNNIEYLVFPDNPFPKTDVMRICHDGSPGRRAMLRDFKCENLGCGEKNSQFDFSNCGVLGVNNDKYPAARTTLTSTFATNSFDRASAGYNSCTLSFSSESKALFTDEEIAQITVKGFTIA